MKKYTNLLWGFALFVFLTTQVLSQTITNTATLNGSFSEPNGQSVTVSIPVDIVRSNGKILELHLNISNVTQTATTLNLRVYELLYTSNVVETPKVEPPIVTPPPVTPPPDTNVVVTPPPTPPPVTNIVVTPPTTPTTTITNPPVVVNPTVTTNNVTLDVTLKLIDNTTKNVLLPGGIVKTNGQISNIIFDLASVPKDAIIIRVKLYDYIYDPNGNIIGIGETNTTTPPTTNDPPVVTPSTDSVKFPVEVFGPDQTTEEFKFVLNDNLNDIYGAQFTIHALNYTNKASVSINGSQWIPLNNKTVVFPRKFDRLWTGIGGPQNTLTMVVPFASNNIIAGITNTIKFKFNDVTKQSIGYRVLNADIVRRQETSEREVTRSHGLDNNPNFPRRNYTNIVYKYNPVTLATTKTIDDPKNWAPMSSDPVVINQGKDLWFKGNIFEKGVQLNAKCTDCHFTDGYDLKYFNYSDKSIIARSKYHGLSEQQGVALASYIRSLDVPYQEKGRPWNPLYQPGPGQGSVPIDNWMAGAGMDWVLDDDIKSFQYIFPNGTQNGIKYNGVVQPIDFKKAYNINEIPIAMQLPDWNHWLPVAHLKDSAPEIWSFSLTNGASAPGFFNWFMNEVPKDKGMFGLVRYMRSYNELVGYNFVHMDDKFHKVYHDAGKGTHYQNKVRMAFRHWVTVRTAEIMQRWKLQDLGHELLEDNANTRDQWNERGARMYMDLGKLDRIKAQFGSSWTNVFNDRRWFANSYPFHLAPHIGGLWAVTDQNNPEFTYEPYGDNSPQWYQLQMYLDDSNRMAEYNIIDWGYIHNILFSATSQWGSGVPYSLYTGKHNALQVLNSIKTYEAFQFNDGYNGLLEGRWTDLHPHVRLLGGTVLWGPVDSANYTTYRDIYAHYIDVLHSKEKKDMMVGVYNQIFKAQLDRLQEYPSAADLLTTFSSENVLRYMGGDANLIQRFVDFRNKTWPDNGYVSKITHVWPAPFGSLQ